MTFSTEKRKIFKMWNDSVENQFQIDNLSSNDQIILTKIDDLNNTDLVYNNIINLSSEWLIPDFQVIGDDDPFQLFKEYEVVINGINKNLIPYIDSKISYRVGVGANSLPIPEASDEPGVDFDESGDMFINNTVEIKKVVDESLRDIVYRTSIFFSNSNGLLSTIQLRFFINIANPSYYQST